MSDEAPTPPPQPPADGPVEKRISPEWIGVGISAASLALGAYNTFKPGQSASPPAESPPPEPPTIQLPPGAKGD